MAEILEFEKKGFIVQFHTAISKLNNDLHNLETNKFAKEYLQICSFEDYANPFPISKFTLSKKQTFTSLSQICRKVSNRITLSFDNAVQGKIQSFLPEGTSCVNFLQKVCK